MDGYDDGDFHSTLEPMVIIDDHEEEENAFTRHQTLDAPLSRPEITIFPVKRKPNVKIKLFRKEYSPNRDEDSNGKVQSTKSHQRTPVRLITQEEARNTGDTYAKRRSSPLEKCPVCKKFFRRMKTHLLKHEMLRRGDTDAFACCICAKVFNNQNNLQIHMRTHTGDKPYVCEVCDKSFSQSCNLVNHVRIHTGERPFKCPHCDRAFTQSGNLNNHIRLHTDEKPFKCHFCDKAFVQSGNLSSHIRNNHHHNHNQGPQ
ncbi:zinc finger protein 239-like isoform X2 [Cylas formicarius]|uniref:zinc finger protein 239-like isoform X2 n=1 Tax=Cylas formicarius TaxID=197179 RepID=UPI0029583E80|nr:zinc finger protein 239-like isoform X2 [Cylas formicarius]